MVVNTSRKSVSYHQVGRYQETKYLEEFLTSGVAEPTNTRDLYCNSAITIQWCHEVASIILYNTVAAHKLPFYCCFFFSPSF